MHFGQLGLAVLVMSSSGALGRYIALPAPVTIWIRCLIAVLVLYILLKVSKKPLFIGWGHSFRIVFLGSLFMAAHWVSYFYALRLSTVAIGMLSLFTYPVITALLEPLVLRTKFEVQHLFLSLIAFVGVFLLVPEFSLTNQATMGVVVGVGSSVMYSFRNLLMKMNLANTGSMTLMYYQLLIITLLLWPVLFIFPLDIRQDILLSNWKPLLLLGVFTTAVGHTLFVGSFRYFSITTVS
ncbi:MAG: DMT family transporter, partial [Cyclobacteriaceae bacterium]|nr:DMT family transporter [Cyclobacteriaceae bacterium]